MIVVIPQTWPLRNDGVALDGNPEWLPRNCPRCGRWAVVGHGRRRRSAHDGQHDWIRQRRAECQQCGVTITVEPAWALPKTHYSLAARAQAVERFVEGQSPLEDCAPDTQAGSRVADPATLRRWFVRRWTSWWSCCTQALVLLPTIFAWDLAAALPMLTPEGKAP